MTGSCCAVCKVAGILVGLGALNWGLYGVFGVDLVASVLGSMTTGAKVVYGLIGVAGAMQLLCCVGIKLCPCQKGSCEKK